MSETKPHGRCVVCGSQLLVSFFRGIEDRRVHCNACGSEVSEALHYRKQMEREADFCITKVLRNDDGKAFCVYLKDGNKITIGRTSETKGPAWLGIGKQAVIRAM